MCLKNGKLITLTDDLTVYKVLEEGFYGDLCSPYMREFTWGLQLLNK